MGSSEIPTYWELINKERYPIHTAIELSREWPDEGIREMVRYYILGAKSSQDVLSLFATEKISVPRETLLQFLNEFESSEGLLLFFGVDHLRDRIWDPKLDKTQLTDHQKRYLAVVMCDAEINITESLDARLAKYVIANKEQF